MYTFCLIVESMKQPGRIFNTWLGDPVKLFLLEEIINVIRKLNLLENVNRTGTKILAGQLELEKDFPIIHSSRGKGLLIAYTVVNGDIRDRIVNRLLQNGKWFNC